jgi:hypothetical protein
MHIRMHQEVLAICTLFMGFVLVKKKHGKLFIDVYKCGSRMIPTEKRFSAQLSQSSYGVSEASVLQKYAIERSIL